MNEQREVEQLRELWDFFKQLKKGTLEISFEADTLKNEELKQALGEKITSINEAIEAMEQAVLAHKRAIQAPETTVNICRLLERIE